MAYGADRQITAIKTATYHAMKSCDGSPEKLRQTLDNICDHYRGNHENCSSESRCKKEENYICSKSELKDPVAISLLTSAIKKNASSLQNSRGLCSLC